MDARVTPTVHRLAPVELSVAAFCGGWLTTSATSQPLSEIFALQI